LAVVAKSPDFGIRVYFGELRFTWAKTRATLLFTLVKTEVTFQFVEAEIKAVL
jgi:hypothetical protein